MPISEETIQSYQVDCRFDANRRWACPSSNAMVRRRAPKGEQLRYCVPTNDLLRKNLQEKGVSRGSPLRSPKAARTRVRRRGTLRKCQSRQARMVSSPTSSFYSRQNHQSSFSLRCLCKGTKMYLHSAELNCK